MSENQKSKKKQWNSTKIISKYLKRKRLWLRIRVGLITKHKISKLILSIVIFILIIQSSIAETTDKTPIKGFVNDYANIISESDEREIILFLEELYDNNQAQIAIVTINSLEGMPIEMYSIELAHENLGDTEKDNGLLYLIALNDRKWRIETGYGLEAILPDLLTYQIGDSIAKKYFKQGSYSEGIKEASSEFYKILSDIEYQQAAKKKYLSKKKSEPNYGEIIFFIFIILMMLGSTGSHKKRRHADNDMFAAAILGSVLFGRGRGGLGGGGFGGGSFGGFGGGGFGGGGSGGGGW